MLTVNNISFQYQKNKAVLKNISFQLKKGEHLCVMGESGCGKSTLLKAIYGLLDVDKGTIFWDDIEILGPKHHLVPGMDFIKHVAQDFDLMPLFCWTSLLVRLIILKKTRFEENCLPI